MAIINTIKKIIICRKKTYILYNFVCMYIAYCTTIHISICIAAAKLVKNKNKQYTNHYSSKLHIFINILVILL